LSDPGIILPAPEPAAARLRPERTSLWGRALDQFRRDHAAITGLAIVAVFFLMAVGVWFGWWGTQWSQALGGRWEGPSGGHWLGTNLLGQDIFQRAVYSTRTAFEIGLIVAILSTLLGGLLGALSGFYSSRWIDSVLLWLMGTLDSIPFYLFVAAVAVAMAGNPWAMHIAMVATFWTTTARLVRGEVIKLKNLEFVEAAHAIGLGQFRIIFRHLLPNTFHILLVQGTIVFVSAIKAEVILSFLGLGVQDGVSWGLMIAESTQEVLAGQYMNFIVASSFMFVLVMAFNLFSDGLQDALDPRRAPR